MSIILFAAGRNSAGIKTKTVTKDYELLDELKKSSKSMSSVKVKAGDAIISVDETKKDWSRITTSTGAGWIPTKFIKL